MSETLRTQLDVGTSTSLCIAAMRSNGLEVVPSPVDGGYLVVGRLTVSPASLVLWPRTHAVRCSVQHGSRGTSIVLSTKYASWYGTALSVLCPIAIGGIAWMVLGPFGPRGTHPHDVWKVVSMLSVLLWLQLGRMLTMDNGRCMHLLSLKIRELHRSKGQPAESLHIGTLSTTLKWTLVYGVCTGFVFAACFCAKHTGSATLPIGFLFGALGVVVALVAVVITTMRVPGLGDRLVPVLPAFGIVIGLIAMSGVGGVFVWARAYNTPLSEVRPERLLSAARVLLCGGMTLTFAGYVLVVQSACVSGNVLRHDADMKVSMSESRVNAAVTGAGAMRGAFRTVICVFISLWVGAMVQFVSLVVPLVAWICGESGGMAVTDSRIAVAAVCGIDPSGWASGVLTVCAWLVAIFPPALLMVVSCGQLAIDLLRKLVWKPPGTRAPADLRVSAVVNELAAKRQQVSPVVAVSQVAAGGVFVAAVPGGPSRTVLWIDPLLAAQLDEQILRALVAHELAHLKAGHPQLHERYRFIGRVLLVGDGIVSILEASYAWEEWADREAVTSYGADPVMLIEGLRAVSALQAARWARRGADGVPAVPAFDVFSAVMVRSGVLARLRAWWFLYTCDTRIAYWHPRLQKRIASLLSLRDLNRGENNHGSTK